MAVYEYQYCGALITKNIFKKKLKIKLYYVFY